METNKDQRWEFRRILKHTYLDGFGEFFDDDLNSFAKSVWCAIMVSMMLNMAFHLYEITRDYSSERLLTTVADIPLDPSEINQPSVCFSLTKSVLQEGTFSSLNPLADARLADLGYLKAMTTHFGLTGLWLEENPGNLTWKEFERLTLKTHSWWNFENTSFLSQEALYSALDNWGIGEMSVKLDNLTGSIYLKSALKPGRNFRSDFQYDSHGMVYDSVVCVSHLEGSETYGYYASRQENNGASTAISAFKMTHYNPLLMSVDLSPWIGLVAKRPFKVTTLIYTVIPRKYKYLSLQSRPCEDPKGLTYFRGQGQSMCVQACLRDYHDSIFNCSFWDDFAPNEQPVRKMCHIFDIFEQIRSQISLQCNVHRNHSGCNAEEMLPLDKWSKRILDTYINTVFTNIALRTSCKEACLNTLFCTEWDFEYNVMEHEIHSDIYGFPNNWSVVILRKELVMPQRYLIYEDNLKTELVDYLNNWGSLLGLYFGGGICAYNQLFFWFFVVIARKFSAKRKQKNAAPAVIFPKNHGVIDEGISIEMTSWETAKK